MKRTEFAVARRALEKMLVRGIPDRSRALRESGQDISRRTADPSWIGIRNFQYLVKFIDPTELW